MVEIKLRKRNSLSEGRMPYSLPYNTLLFVSSHKPRILKFWCHWTEPRILYRITVCEDRDVHVWPKETQNPVNTMICKNESRKGGQNIPVVGIAPRTPHLPSPEGFLYAIILSIVISKYNYGDMSINVFWIISPNRSLTGFLNVLFLFISFIVSIYFPIFKC